MVTYKCDTCGRIKDPKEAWIMGFAAENIGVTQARREVAISAKWDEAKAVDWLAVHFCCVECKDKYMDKLFSQAKAASVKPEIEEEPEVVLRREPGTLARAMTEPPLKIVRRKKKPAVTRRTVRRRAG